MSSEMKDYELNGYIDKNHHLVLAEKELPFDPQDVTIIVRPKKDKDKKSKAERFNSFRGALKDWKVDGLEFQREIRK